MKQKVVLFGSSGGIGSELSYGLKAYEVINVERRELDFDSNYIKKLEKILYATKPDVIINASGIFGDNSVAFDSIFNINVKSNWDVINYYIKNPTTKKVKFVVIGSSAYNQGRRNYILYAASKAALHSIYEGCKECMEGTKFIIGIVHPTKVETNMIKHVKAKGDKTYLSPKTVSDKIIRFIHGLNRSSCITIKK